jgi:hypothetical protein
LICHPAREVFVPGQLVRLGCLWKNETLTPPVGVRKNEYARYWVNLWHFLRKPGKIKNDSMVQTDDGFGQKEGAFKGKWTTIT